MVVRDARVYFDPIDGKVYHYRDSDALEVDVIVWTGRAWGAFEVKLGVDLVDEAAEHLLKVAVKVDAKVMGEPAVLAVVTAPG